MICQIEIPHKPYSVNALYYRDGKRKKRETVEWEQSILEYLRDDNIQPELAKIRDNFDKFKHSIYIDIEYIFPHSILYTQKGCLSSKAFDISNMEKPLIDVIFLPKFSSESCKNLEIDDRYISKMSSSKSSGSQHSIRLRIELLPLSIPQTDT